MNWLSLTKFGYVNRSPDMAEMHQDTSEDHQVVAEKLKEIFGVTFLAKFFSSCYVYIDVKPSTNMK